MVKINLFNVKKERKKKKNQKKMLNILLKLFHKRFKIKKKYKLKKKVAFLSIRKKKKITLYFLKYFLKFNVLLNQFGLINIRRIKNNTFINYSTIYGKILLNYSSGMFSNGSIKKTFFGINSLINNFFLNFLKFKKKYIYIRLIGDFFRRGFKKNIKLFFLKFKKPNYIFRIKSIKFKAHNGVRLKKPRRK